MVELGRIIQSHLEQFAATLNPARVQALIRDFDERRRENQEVSTDQLLNAVFLTAALPDRDGRTFSEAEFETLKENLLRQLSGPAA